MWYIISFITGAAVGILGFWKYFWWGQEKYQKETGQRAVWIDPLEGVGD